MAEAALQRRLRLGDAVLIGLGSMIGAGIFASFAPAAAAAGTGLLFGLAVAGFIAFCNATSSAQLAAQHPTSGGTYAYGRAQLGPWPGFLAGWSFVIGKTASSAAMAITFATYVVAEPFVKPVAIAAVIALTTVNAFGVTRTARLTRVLVALSLVTLAIVVAIGATNTTAIATAPGTPITIYGTLQSAGLLFFAFAGYARIATMGEEVIDPVRTIPRAITIALATTLVIYALVGAAALHALGPSGLAASPAPLAAVSALANLAWTGPVVALGAAAASLGALLALIAGVGRTSLAMAREHDLPSWLATVNPRFRVSVRAEATLAVIVVALIAVSDLRSAIGFSSFGVLLYYFIANVSAFTQDDAHRRYPRFLTVVGALGCLILLATLPVTAIIAGVVVVAVGIGYRLVRTRVASADGGQPQ